MSYAAKTFYCFDVCHKILGIILFGCLSAEVASHAVQWPAGKYGLPMAASGCPKANGFSWKTGYIYQDLEDDKSYSGTSSSFHLNASVLSSGDVHQNFCIKMNKSSSVDKSRSTWPYGQYCIYKKGSSCPTPLLDGWVLWDDENGKSGSNLNFQSGIIPAGTYKQDTKIQFCCQTVGSTSMLIKLPIDSPFYLMAFNNKRCQEVLKTIHTMEYIRYDTEDDVNHDSQAYPYPFGADFHEPYIYYCYYQACRWTKTALTGSFSSPNYPSTYKNNAWCEWYINVPWNYIISLSFVDFRLETIGMCVTHNCDCDYVVVQDNFSNGTSVVLGKYCMGIAYPHGAIKSRSNNVTVTFRSDNTIGKAGFKARYEAIQVIAPPTSLGSTTKKTQVTTRTVVSTVVPATSPLSGATSKATSSSNNATTGTTDSSRHTTTAEITSSEGTTTKPTTPATNVSVKPTSEATTAVTRQNDTTTLPFTNGPSTTRSFTTPATNVSVEPTSEATTAFTRQNDTTALPFTNASSTTRSFTTDEQIRTTPRETTKGTSTTKLATEQHVPSTERSTGKEPTDTATANEEGAHGARNENPSKAGNVYVIVGVTVSLIVISVVMVGSIFCLCRRRQLQRNQVERGKQCVVFTAAEKNVGVSNYVPDMHGTSEENEEEERYTNITTKEKVNILYDNRAFMDADEKYVEDDEIKESDNPLYSSSEENEEEERYTNITTKEKVNILHDNRAFMDADEKYVEDDEIKESVNPLYCSSVETDHEQDENQNVLYESMDEISQNIIEAETVNPVYERLV